MARLIVTASPAYADCARTELDLALPAEYGRTELEPGTWLVSAAGTFTRLAAGLRQAVFIRHACPAQAEVPLSGASGPDDWAASALPSVWTRLAGLNGAGELQVQVRLLAGAPAWAPGPLAAGVRACLQRAGAATVGGAAPRVLSVVCGPDRAWVGVAALDQQLSPWPGGVARLRRRPDEVSRSARKLEEALRVFQLHQPDPADEAGHAPLPPPGGRAIDLGAAPGGWTQFLLAHGLNVVAVDTGELAPQLRGAPGLTVLRGAAQRVALPDGPVDLLTCDLSWDPVRAARCALRFRPLLRAGAPAVLTIKFFGRPPLQAVAAARDQLASGFRVHAIRHLYHDRAEATAYLRA